MTKDQASLLGWTLKVEANYGRATHEDGRTLEVVSDTPDVSLLASLEELLNPPTPAPAAPPADPVADVIDAVLSAADFDTAKKNLAAFLKTRQT